jgi:hypothetical protein
MLLAGLSDAEMTELAAVLAQRGHPGGTRELAAAARAWIAGRQWEDLEAADVDDMTDAQALSGIARLYEGGLDALIASRGYPAGSRF